MQPQEHLIGKRSPGKEPAQVTGQRFDSSGCFPGPRPGLIDGKPYPAGKESAEFLRKLLGDQKATCFVSATDRPGPNRRPQGICYVGAVRVDHEMILCGWAVADHMRTSLVLDALQMALDRRRPPAGVIFHSDRGTQYTSQEFADFCRKNDIRRSLGRTGVCWDNAVAESFFATYKKELIHNRPWPTINQLKTETFSWIEAYYNRTRRHSTLDYLTPSEYELGYRNIHELAA